MTLSYGLDMQRTVRFVLPRAFLRSAKGVFSDDDIEAAKAKLALNPSLGEMIQGTGGCRKIRHRGMSGQSRMIYYYHLGDSEVFFLACYPKNEKSDLTKDEKDELKATVTAIKEAKRDAQKGGSR